MANWDFEFVCQLCYQHFTSKSRGKQREPYNSGKLARRAQEVVDYHWLMCHPGAAIRPIVIASPEPNGGSIEGAQETEAANQQEQA